MVDVAALEWVGVAVADTGCTCIFSAMIRVDEHAATPRMPIPTIPSAMSFFTYFPCIGGGGTNVAAEILSAVCRQVYCTELVRRARAELAA